MGGGMRRWGRKTAAPQTAPSVEPSGAVARLVVPRAWALLPLRLFLGLTFVDAGVGKLLSSAYFGSGSEGFASLARALTAGCCNAHGPKPRRNQTLRPMRPGGPSLPVWLRRAGSR